jgi:hypothetical protein
VLAINDSHISQDRNLTMKHGLFTYAWDLDAEGYETALDAIAEAGFSTVNLATQYHAGKLLLPRNRQQRVYFQEDGAVFFRPDRNRYRRLMPRVHSLVEEDGSPVERLIRLAPSRGLSYTAWTVCLHNTWLGEQFLETTMHTAFGDPLIHSLSPAHPDVREYILALLADLTSRHEVPAIQLESPGYMGFIHGFHHEIIGVALDEIQRRLLGISFNPVEIAGAANAGIDAEGVRRRVADLLDASWNRGVRLMEGEAVSRAAREVLEDGEFLAYTGWLEDQEISLLEEIRATIRDVSPETTIWHFAALDGSERDKRLIATGGGILSGYASSDEDARERAARALAFGIPVRGAIRAIAPDTISPETIAPRMAAWKEAGVEGVDIYNYGLMPGLTWDAVRDALNGRATPVE